MMQSRSIPSALQSDRQPIPLPLATLLLVTLALSGCGGGGEEPIGIDDATQFAFEPSTVPESLDSTVRLVNLGPAQGPLTLVVGGQRIPIRQGERVEIDAFALAAGSHEAVVEAGGEIVASATLHVAPQPTIDTLDPDSVEADSLDPLVIHGTGLQGPLEVLLEDDRGNGIGEPLPATANGEGTRASCPPPFPMPMGAETEVFVQVRCADGQRAGRARRLTLRRSYRTIDGTQNSRQDPARGSAEIALLRKAPADYADGISALVDRTNPRTVSNEVCAQDASVLNDVGATDYLWQWGQFLDHDIDLTLDDSGEDASIAVPAGDPWFDPFNTGVVVIPLHRSRFVAGTEPRQQENAITAFIDASNVYGSDDVRAQALRTLDGTGRLKTSAGNLLPFNVDGLPNAGGPDASLFLAGDIRANEQLGLTCMHTLFVREHNRLAGRIRADHPRLSGDEVYEEARRIVGAQMQVITFEEFLPVLLGRSMGPYRGYNPRLDPGIANEFSTAGYRLGHSLLSDTLLRVDADGDEIADGHLSLRDAFFQPLRLASEGGIDPVLRGLAAQVCQQLDAKLVDDVRNFLFGPPGAGGLDLAALNIQRGRDHGLATYNDMRAAYGLARRTRFDQITSDADLQTQLAAAYASVDAVDAWVGGLCEDHRDGGLVGDLFAAILVDQFDRLRHGDRYWYERTFTGRERNDLRATGLSDIIRRNTSIGNELPRNVFQTGLPSGTTVVATR